MKRCKRCMLRAGKFHSPEGDFDVILDERGICNFCHYFDDHIKPILNYSILQQQFKDRLNSVRGKFKYDALVGLSGGKDSTYILYKLVKKYKLNVLAVTYDNSFLTDYALESIKNTLQQFDIDYELYVPNKECHRKFYKAATLKLANPCTACATGGYFLALKYCFEKKIPFFIHGRSPYQMFSTMYAGTKDIFSNIMYTNLEEHCFKTISDVYKQLHIIMRDFIRGIFEEKKEAEEVLNEFFLNPSLLSSEFAPESLSYYLFHPYNEEKIKEELSHQIGWKRSKNEKLLSHYDCTIHDAVNYIFRTINDIELIEPEIAVMLRMGDISLEKANNIIRDARSRKGRPQKSIQSLCNICDIGEKAIDQVVSSMKRPNL